VWDLGCVCVVLWALLGITCDFTCVFVELAVVAAVWCVCVLGFIVGRAWLWNGVDRICALRCPCPRALFPGGAGAGDVATP
jgi:hypothetical protein